MQDIRVGIRKGEYDNMLAAFKQGLRLLDVDYLQDSIYVTTQKHPIGKLQRLLAMRSKMLVLMSTRAIGGPLFDPFFDRITAYPIKPYFAAYEKRRNIDGEKFFQEIMAEINSSDVANWAQMIKFKWHTTFGNENTIMGNFPKPFLSDPANQNLSKAQLDIIMRAFKDKPSVLADLAMKPNLFRAIAQGLLCGMIDDVIAVYNQMHEIDKKTFDSFMSGYLDRAFCNLDSKTILDIYSDEKYPSSLRSAVAGHLAQATLSRELMYGYFNTVERIKLKNRYPSCLLEIFCNILRLAVRGSVDKKMHDVDVERTLREISDLCQRATLTECEQARLVNVMLHVKDDLLDLNNPTIRGYLDEIGFYVFKKPLRDAVIKSPINAL